jgi:glycosyltransferase involved in cell wall biosynthesis
MTSARPTFSVIMPAYNAERTIGSAIRSVLQQSRDDFELIVVDDGSTDDTARCVGEFGDPRIRFLTRAHGGPAAARNKGIEVACGVYVSMLDSDDMWLPSYLETMDAALRAAPSAALAYTDAWVLDGDTGRIRSSTAMAYWRPPSTPPVDPRTFLLLLLDRNFIFTSATVRRTVLTDLGGYDERLWYAEDYELWVRIVAAGHSAVRGGDVLAIHRDRADSLTSNTARLYQGICRVYDVIREKHDFDPAARTVVQDSQNYWQQQLRAIEQPSLSQRLMRTTRTLRRRIRDRSLWLEHPPSQVVETLRACRVVSG